MARRPPPAAAHPEPPLQAVESPILGGPYTAPERHWVYDRASGTASRAAGRRPAGFYTAQWRAQREQLRLSGTETQEEEFEELPLVNRLRQDLAKWRQGGYVGATPVTKALLQHWIRADHERPLFFCQREAVEAVIFVLELLLPGRRPRFGLEVTAEDLSTLADGDLLRLGCKMATGSGKTVVMAMLIAWTLANQHRAPRDERFAGAVLVCCPNLTIRERLQVLRTELADNYYQRFNLLPTTLPQLPPGRVQVHNWHRFRPAGPHVEGGTAYRVVDKGDENPAAFSRRLLGPLADHRLLVLNDEGHHAWRPRPLEPELAELLTADEVADREEATVWVAGLDRFAAGCGVRATVDLSATPFYLAASGHPEGQPFPWLVSDFGLVDAIECGIVKIPRLPVSDTTGNADPKFYRLWRNLCEALPPGKFIGGKGKGRPKPEAVFEYAQDALTTLASQWHTAFEQYQAARPGQEIIPPVMIVVCNETNLAEHVFERISGERQEELPAGAAEGRGKGGKQTVYGDGLAGFPELWNSAAVRRTIRIDSRLLAQAESSDGGSKQDAAEELRRIVSTVGRPGEPGEQVRCVVAVAMLNEGWDANNVTHILGLRAFGSQLLCEQVVGRALRRRDYGLNPETQQLDPEYADIYGIPFTLIPFKGNSQQQAPDVVRQHVRALPERADWELRFPIVEGFTVATPPELVCCDVAAVEPTVLRPEELPPEVAVGEDYLFGALAVPGSPLPTTAQDRQTWWDRIHPQAIEYAITRELVSRLTAWTATAADAAEQRHLARHQVFPQVLKIVRQYLATRVDYRGQRREELALDLYRQRVIDLLTAAIRPVDASGECLTLPLLNRWRPVGTTGDVNFKTTCATVPTQRSQIDQVVLHRGWEQVAAHVLDHHPQVAYYARNEQLGLTVPYEFEGLQHSYEPDFLVRLNDRWKSVLVLEVKGASYDDTATKHAAARRWRDAVNNLRGWNDRLPAAWRFWVTRDPQALPQELTAVVSVPPGAEDSLSPSAPAGSRAMPGRP